MSKVKQLDLRKQEVVDECDEMRWENEGVRLSDVQVKIVEYAFMLGFIYAHPTTEEGLEHKCITCDTPIVFGGYWGYCKPCLREYATKRLPEIKAKIQREQDDE